MRFAPKAWRLPMTLLLKPETMATMSMTVVTPRTMPRVVSPARSFCSRMAPSAKRTFSKKPRRKTSRMKRMIPTSLVTQGFDGGLARREPRGRDAGEDTGHDRDDEAQDHD